MPNETWMIGNTRQDQANSAFNISIDSKDFLSYVFMWYLRSAAIELVAESTTMTAWSIDVVRASWPLKNLVHFSITATRPCAHPGASFHTT